MAFKPKAGCPMCSIVAAVGDVDQASDARPEILWRDDNFTAYRERVSPVSSKVHVIIAFKWVCPVSISYRPTLMILFKVCTFLRCTRWYVFRGHVYTISHRILVSLRATCPFLSISGTWHDVFLLRPRILARTTTLNSISGS